MYSVIYKYYHDLIFTPDRGEAYKRKIRRLGVTFSALICIAPVIMIIGDLYLAGEIQWISDVTGCVALAVGLVLIWVFFKTMAGLKHTEPEDRIELLQNYMKKKGWLSSDYCDYLMTQIHRSETKKDNGIQMNSRLMDFARSTASDLARKAIEKVMVLFIATGVFVKGKFVVASTMQVKILVLGIVFLIFYFIFFFVLVPVVAEAERDDKICTLRFEDDLLFLKAKLVTENA